MAATTDGFGDCEVTCGRRWGALNGISFGISTDKPMTTPTASLTVRLTSAAPPWSVALTLEPWIATPAYISSIDPAPILPAATDGDSAVEDVLAGAVSLDIEAESGNLGFDLVN